MGRENRSHEKNLEHLLHHGIFEDIKGILVVAQEVELYSGKKRLIAVPDGLVFDGKTLYIIEYKNNAHGENEAREQLRRAEQYLKDLGITVPIKTLFYHGVMQ
nr:hypothetical protein [Nanoarchaeum sp.]